MLAQVANYCPVLSRNTIVEKSTCVASHQDPFRISVHMCWFSWFWWNSAKAWRSSRRPFSTSHKFYRGQLGITHHGEIPEADEELLPSLENLITLTGLHRIHKDLTSCKTKIWAKPSSQNTGQLKARNSQALTAFRGRSKPAPLNFKPRENHPKASKICSLCKQECRLHHDHSLSTCSSSH